ncbi:MAG: hypothetical protein L0191_14540, partial [Acidobacteria bacterium]|nr:hypothetical protein [Acidobacteriota bacterium]
KECFDRIFRGPRPLHSVFVALATEPEVAFGLQRRSASRRRASRCPLCGFPTTDFEPGARDLPFLVSRAIRLDFPGWKAEMGLCRQCADVYRVLSSRMTRGVPCAPPPV